MVSESEGPYRRRSFGRWKNIVKEYINKMKTTTERGHEHAKRMLG